MGVEMFLYLPLVAQCDLDNPPTIDEDVSRITESIRTYQAPEDADDDNDNWRGPRDPELEAIKKAHEDRAGWINLLAWSHGASNGSSRWGGGAGKSNMQDLSMTKYCDNYSPLMTVMVMVGEVLPHAFLRVCYKPTNGAFKVIEMGIKGVQSLLVVQTWVTSISTGGSGGEDRLTENISISFQSLFMRHVKINIADSKFLEDSRGSWDGEKKEGHREGLFNALPLKQLVKKVISDQVDLFDPKKLASLPKAILEELDLGHLSVRNVLPLKGRLLLVTDEELQENTRKNHFREVYLKKLTVEALKEAIAALYKVPAATVKSVYKVSSALVLLENNDQVWELGESEQLQVVFNK